MVQTGKYCILSVGAILLEFQETNWCKTQEFEEIVSFSF